MRKSSFIGRVVVESHQFLETDYSPHFGQSQCSFCLFFKKKQEFFFLLEIPMRITIKSIQKIANGAVSLYFLQTTKNYSKTLPFLSWENFFLQGWMDTEESRWHTCHPYTFSTARSWLCRQIPPWIWLQGLGVCWSFEGQKHVDFLSFSSRGETNLGGGNSNIFWCFHPDFLGKMIQIDEYFFFRWVATTI